MLYNLVERAKYGNKQVNRVELLLDLETHGWLNTSQLYKEGVVSKAIAERYKYISGYDPLDWVEEESNIKHHSHYNLP